MENVDAIVYDIVVEEKEMGGIGLRAMGSGIKTLEMAMGVVGFGEWERAGEVTKRVMVNLIFPFCMEDQM